MPKIAHTMAIPPGFSGVSEERYESKKSSKNLLRISGLALVFMLAVALLVSAISFTRVGAGEIKESNATATVAPDIRFLDIATPEKYQPFVMNGSSANSYFAQFTYYPATYKNFFGFIGGIYTGISGFNKSDTAVSMEASAIGNVRERLYAYYKLPDELVELGAEIEISANLDEAVKFTAMQNTLKFISYASDVTEISKNSDYVNDTFNKGTTWTVTAANQYILMYAGGEEAGGEKIEISGLAINIKIKSVKSVSAYETIAAKLATNIAPVTRSWNGTTKYSEDFSEFRKIAQGYETNRNTVANLGTWGLHDGDMLDPASNTLTSIRTDGTQTKQFSFLLYDKYLSLDTADIKGFDLFQAYRGTGAIVDGSAKTYKRSDYTAEQLKTLRYPVGLESITVEPFGAKNNDASTGYFRGLYVTVVYDGLGNPKIDGETPSPLEVDTAYRVQYANVNKVSGNTLTVFCGGIDYTKPAALNEVALLTENPTEKVFNDKDGVTYFYTDTIKFTPILENDDTRGDVKYFYTLYKRNANGAYVEIEGQIGIAINNPGSDIFTLSGLETGEYAIKFKAIDTVGQFYENLVKDKTPEQIEGLNLNDVQKIGQTTPFTAIITISQSTTSKNRPNNGKTQFTLKTAALITANGRNRTSLSSSTRSLPSWR